MIGVDLAGFFVLAETNSNSKIVINPCMTPSALPDLSAEYQEALRQLEEKTYSWADAEMRVVTYGIFTKDVDVRDKEIFVKIYGRDMCGMNNYCIKEKLIGQQNLKFRIEESTKYFEHICSLNC